MDQEQEGPHRLVEVNLLDQGRESLDLQDLEISQVDQDRERPDQLVQELAAELRLSLIHI